MKMMKIGLVFSVLLLSASSFASGGGGGVLAAARAALLKASSGTLNSKSQEIIFSISESNSSEQFAFGKLENNQWKIKKFEVLKSDIDQDEVLLRALLNSKTSNSWVDVNPNF